MLRYFNMSGSSPWIDSSGWLGAVLLTLAYAVVWFRPHFTRRKAYAGLNILGCSLLLANSSWHRAWPSALTNVIWCGIAVCGLLHRWGMEKNSKAVEISTSQGREDFGVELKES